MGVDFKVKEHLDIDESYPEILKNEEIALYLAELKFDAYKGELADKDLLITADTIVCIDNHVLGKPQNRDNAIKMIQLLSGRTHTVYTGICVGSKNKKKVTYDKTEVTMITLDSKDIEAYIDVCKPYDKAGSYGIQDWVGYVGIERISGSFYNVMGLPTHLLYNVLREFDD